MSWEAIKWAGRQLVQSSDKFVLVTLAIHANEKTLACFPAVSTIAAECSLTSRSVHRSLKRLVGAGLIGIKRQTLDGLQIESAYDLYLKVGVPPREDTESRHHSRRRSDSGASRSDSVPLNRGHRVRQILPEQKEVSPSVALAEPDRGRSLEEAFGPFWRAYPKPVGKMDAEREFKKAITLAPPSEIMAGLRRYLTNLPVEARYIPAPAAWLRKQRWTDEAPRANATVRSNPKPRTGAISLEEAGRLGL